MENEQVIENRRQKFELLNPNYKRESEILYSTKVGNYYSAYNLITGEFIDGIVYKIEKIDSKRVILYEVVNNYKAYDIILFPNGKLVKLNSGIEFFDNYEQDVGISAVWVYNTYKENNFIVSIQFFDKDTGKKLGQVETYGRYCNMSIANIEGYGKMIHLSNGYSREIKEIFINRSGMYTLGKRKVLKRVYNIQKFWEKR